ncbi:MAG TPA: CmpA/NrtA family ABC transporter substrate-binding protein [Gammaproteobacteria bacterium]|nr:CmpA/NrtA family ABC transporter substrate-binding protein [Gammaproteobacteria bacterium]
MTERVVAAFVPLVDCAVLVAAREQGFAAAEGIDLALVKEPSWASLRDHLSLGHVDCAHALAPLPVALTLGVGQVRVDCVVPFVLNRGGNAITLATALVGEMTALDADALATPERAGRALAAVAGRREAPLTLGMVFPFSNHNFDLRYWLAAAGMHPDRDVRLVAIPPPLMVDSLRAELIDGFCVGEPWNSLAVAEGLGSIVATQAQLFPGAAEKVLAVRTEFAESNSGRMRRLLHALDRAAAWADDAAQHPELAAHLARPDYLDVPRPLIEAALSGRLPFGSPSPRHGHDFMHFHRRAANLPSAADGLWSYAQMVRWGQLPASPRQQRLAGAVFRSDLYRRNVAVAGPEPPQSLSFDRIAFSPTDVPAYLRLFALSTPFTDFHAP